LPFWRKPNPSRTNATMLTQATPTRQNHPAGRSRHCGVSGVSEGESTLGSTDGSNVGSAGDSLCANASGARWTGDFG
jgi:hypothetical protein